MGTVVVLPVERTIRHYLVTGEPGFAAIIAGNCIQLVPTAVARQLALRQHRARRLL